MVKQYSILIVWRKKKKTILGGNHKKQNSFLPTCMTKAVSLTSLLQLQNLWLSFKSVCVDKDSFFFVRWFDYFNVFRSKWHVFAFFGGSQIYCLHLCKWMMKVFLGFWFFFQKFFQKFFFAVFFSKIRNSLNADYAFRVRNKKKTHCPGFVIAKLQWI